jgi:hypothetical protein
MSSRYDMRRIQKGGEKNPGKVLEKKLTEAEEFEHRMRKGNEDAKKEKSANDARRKARKETQLSHIKTAIQNSSNIIPPNNSVEDAMDIDEDEGENQANQGDHDQGTQGNQDQANQGGHDQGTQGNQDQANQGGHDQGTQGNQNQANQGDQRPHHMVLRSNLFPTQLQNYATSKYRGNQSLLLVTPTIIKHGFAYKKIGFGKAYCYYIIEDSAI